MKKIIFLTIVLIFKWSAVLANPLVPGIFESLEKIIALDSKESSEWSGIRTISEQEFLNKVKAGTIFYIAPEFLQSILFNSSPQQLALISANPCALADLAWLNQLRHGNGLIEAIPLIYSPGKASFETLWVSRVTWAKFMMSTKCKKSEEMAYYFSSKNLANALSQVTVKIPKDDNECSLQFDASIADPKMPYYCYLVDAAAKGDLSLKTLKENPNNKTSLDGKKRLIVQSLKVKELLGFEKFNYLKNNCDSLANKENFCNQFFTEEFWKKKTALAENGILLKPTCSDLDAKSCADKIARNPDFCLWSMLDYPALLPRPSCLESSRALNYTRLDINYRDCPGRLRNPSITNAGRILLHFGYDKILSDKKNQVFSSDKKWSPDQSCSSNVADSFLDFTAKIKWDDVWNSKICYTDRLQRKNYCAPYLLTNDDNSPFALTNTVSEILKKSKRMDKSYLCQLIEFRNFDSKSLKFRSGCWILIPSLGELTSSPIKVVVDDREQRDLFSVTGDVTFAYQSFQNANSYNNFQNQIEKELKILPSSITTLNNAMAFLLKPKALLHGVGCIEELLPDYFQINNLGDCRPIPFIISGVIKGKNVAEAAMVVQTSIDEIASPRLIPWQQVLSSVEAYQRYSPQNSWSLYGLSR